MLEVTATSTLLDYWIHIPHWITCLALLSIFGSINLIGVKYFGEAEFWFAGIKIAVIIFMIITGTWLILTHNVVHATAINNLHNYSSSLQAFFTHNFIGFLNALVIVCLSFCGAEFVSVAAGEAENPKKSIPIAVNGVIVKIILFYVLTMVIIVLMYPAKDISDKNNPFTDVLFKLGFTAAAGIINLVAITAALSSLNSCIYVAARMLYRLSLNHQAPKYLAKVNNTHSPQNAILFTTLIAFIVVILNYIVPHKILVYLFALITLATIIGWYIILITHISFRRKKMVQGITLEYRAPFYPYSNILVMAVLLVILIGMSINPAMQLCVYLAPIWLSILFFSYKLSCRRLKKQRNVG